MHNALSQHRGKRAAALLASALTLGLAAAGCGGSSVSTSTATTSSGSAGSGAGSRETIASRCAAQANGDPGAIGLCLASHGVILPSHGQLVTCVQAANTRAEVTACLAKAAR